MTSNGSIRSQFGKPIPETVDALGRRFVVFGQRMNDRFDIPKTVNSLKSFANEHPVFVLVLALMATLCAIPILAFVCFVVATLGFTFMGFIFVEGTLLTVGTFLLSGVLFFVGFLALGFSAFVAAAWFVVNKAFSALSLASYRLNVRHTTKQQQQQPIANGLHNND